MKWRLLSIEVWKTIGIISDTHRKLPAAAVAALRGEYAQSQAITRVMVDTQDVGLI